jgi:hypothetical protein
MTKNELMSGDKMSSSIAPGSSNSSPKKSFVAPAALSLVMYYVGFYVVGLILNITFLTQSNQIQETTGESPQGRGCLWALLIVHLWIPALVVFAAVLVSLFGGLSVLGVLGDWWREGTGLF